MFKTKPYWQGKVYLTLFIIYATAILVGVSHHEPWRDEAQAWLLTRDLSLTGLLRILPSEGHPPLWYLLIMPLAKMGLPYASQNWMAGAFAIIAVYIILFKTRLHPVLKSLLPFSYFFFFEYALFARSYSLILFFIAIFIWLYPRRFEKPLLFALCVACLFNTHVLLFSFCFTVCLVYLWDIMQYKAANKKTIAGLSIMSISGLYLVPYLFIRDADPFKKAVDHYNVSLSSILNEAFLMYLDSGIIGILLGICLIIGLLHRTKPLLLLAGGLSGVLYILMAKYIPAVRHDGIVFIIAIAVYGTSDNYDNDPQNLAINDRKHLLKYSWVLLAVMMIFQLRKSVIKYNRDQQLPISDARGAAEYLLNHNLESRLVVGDHAWAAMAVIPYLPNNIKFYDARCQRYFTYITYDTCYFEHANSEPADYVISLAGNALKSDAMLMNAIFLFNRPVKEDMEQYLDLLYSSAEDVVLTDERFYIYKIKKAVLK